MASAAAALVRPGSTIILDGGTTTLSLVRYLPRSLEVTIVTHSPTVAAALIDHEAEVVLIGGRLFKHSAVAVGAVAAEAAGRISADQFFLGVTGIHPDAALTTGDAEEAAMKRILSSRSTETWVLGSEEKIGAVSPHLVLPLAGVTGLVLDAPAGDPTVTELRAGGAHIVAAH